VTMSLEKSGTGDLIMQFSDGLTTLDCTPAATVTLTAGSDTSPTENFVYVLQSTKALTLSTSDWPATEHIKVGYFLVPTAGFVQTNGVYINQNWNDHLTGTANQGHLLHMAERSRRLGARYFSGVDGNGTSGYLTPTASNVELKATAGVVYQMHKHTDITADSGGNAIGNNKYFNLIIWGVANKPGEYTPMVINLPSGFYANQADATNDVSGYDDFTMPREFNLESASGFLVARITIQMGTTWSVISTVDLRGSSPQTATGGASGISSIFADNVFQIFDESDVTKILAFDVGTGVTTGNTRTVQVANADGIMAYTSQTDGTIDHGADVVGLADDDHPQYIKDTEFTQDSGILGAQGQVHLPRKQGLH